MKSRIVIGADVNNPLYEFSGADVKTISIALASALVGDELAYDIFTPVIYTEAYIRLAYATSEGELYLTSDGATYMCVLDAVGGIKTLPYGTPIWYYSNGVLMGKFYSKTVERLSTTDFEIYAVSSVGILDGQIHNGGIYVGQTFETVAADIIGGAVKFSCAADVANIQVFGWLPVATKRENLHQLLFASGVNLIKDENGDVLFSYLETGKAKHISDDRIFMGGSVLYNTPASRVEVTEHTFLSLDTDAVVTLYDNTDGSGAAHNTRVEFSDAPIHDLTATGTIVIHESGVNYAVISGTGTLTGKTYSHAMRIVSREAESSNVEQKTVSVTEATLVSTLNSNAVAERLYAYYSSAQTVNSEIVVNDEKPGDQIVFNNPYSEQVTAFLASMDINASSFLRASCEMIAGYVPPAGGGGSYTKVEVLTGSGTWENTDGAESARIVLVGGGQGGSSGAYGKAGANGRYYEDIRYGAGEGGAAGRGGFGGLILVEDIDLSGVESLEFSCGAGGAGGVHSSSGSVSGSEGTATTFGAYTSADGTRTTVGVTNLFTGEVFGLPGKEGVAGARGSDEGGSHTLVYKGVVYYPGANAGTRVVDGKYTVYGGFGGGPAAGSNGNAGKNGYVEIVNGKVDNSNGGDGGSGAIAVAPDATAGYGHGGNGGNGGGGGGIGGRGEYIGSGGSGGAGSDGGPGGDGLILIYT